MNHLARNGISRRSVLAGVPAAVAGALLWPATARGESFVDAAKVGDLQAAIDRVADGGTVFTSDPNMTFGGAKLNGRQNIIINGLKIIGGIGLAGCTGIVITACSFSGASEAIVMYTCTRCVVSRCLIQRGCVGAYGPTQCEFVENTFQQTLANAIGVAGLPDMPASGNRYLRNRIEGCNRIGIEEWASSPALCTGGVIDGNVINAVVGIGISVTGSDPVVTGNTIADSTWGIEVVGARAVVARNTITASAPQGSGVLVIGTPLDETAPAAKVLENSIKGVGSGIELLAYNDHGPLRNVLVGSNTLTDCGKVAINASPERPSTAVQVMNNTVTFASPVAGGDTRVGIKTGDSIAFDGNSINYVPGSQGSAKDVPIQLVGNNVTLRRTRVDGGGRTADTNLLPITASSPAGTYTGWRYLDNAYYNGATVDKSGATAVEDTDPPA